MRNIALLFTFFLFSSIVCGQSFNDDIYRFVNQNNVDSLVLTFNNPVHLKVVEEESICSVNQARKELEHFFLENPPLSFLQNYEGDAGNGRSTIGTFQSANNNFYRIYFLYKVVDHKNKIFQFFIESDNINKNY